MTATSHTGVEEKLALIQTDYTGYMDQQIAKRERSIEYPHTVSIETLVRCNASCSFCPYPTSPRQGQEMPTWLFEKIIDDLTAIPRDHKFTITLTRINEPLLDSRLERFHEIIAERLPSASAGFWSNGTMIIPGRFEWMAKHKGAYLCISLNSIDDVEHKEMMGFGTKKVFRNLDHLHALKVDRKFPPFVQLCAPFRSTQQAREMQQFCAERWPKFRLGVRPFFEWVGGSNRGLSQRSSSDIFEFGPEAALGFACGQWFQMHILASGQLALCCLDETGRAGDEFNARHNVLSLYQKSLELRSNLPARRNIGGCETCLHLG